jgi:hypothetical protein
LRVRGTAAAPLCIASFSKQITVIFLFPFDSKTLDERYAIARSVGEECIQEDELRALLAKKPEPTCYDGFEPSGRMHIAQGVLKAINVNKLTSVGCRFIFWVADWFALLNNKMGGDLRKIQKVGEYLIEVRQSHPHPPPLHSLACFIPL